MSDHIESFPGRASLSELKEFANKVRAAGGGNPIDALLPATPSDSSQCLIARNLNFNCTVSPRDRVDFWDGTRGWKWYMFVDSPELADRIGEALGLEVQHDEERCENRIALPRSLALLAEAFDHLEFIATRLRRLGTVLTPEERDLFNELAPYVQESRREAWDLATVVNDDGSIVI